MQINQSTLKALTQGFKKLFFNSFRNEELVHSKIAMVTTSTNASETYTWLGAFSGLKKLVGEVVVRNLTAAKLTIFNEEYEETIGVKRADIERDSIGLYTPIMETLGSDAATHPDELLGVLMSKGFVEKDYTGKAFYAADKKHEPDNNKSAKFTNKGTAALTADSYAAAKTALRGMKNAAGRSMKLGRKLALVVPPALEDTAKKIIKAATIEGGNTNIQQDTAEIIVFPDLETDTEWHLLDVGKPIKPFIIQNEVAADLASQTDMNSDHVFKKHEFLYQAYRRGGAGYGLPQLAYGSTGVDA